MLVCEVIYGKKRGAELVELVEAATGEACPCRQDRPCPLMPSGEPVPLVLAAPR